MIRTHSVHRAASALAAFVMLSPLALAAQTGRIVLTPYAAVYAPANDVARLDLGTGGVSAVLTAKHKSAFAYGANASYWLSERAAIEVGAAYAMSDLHYTGLIDQGDAQTPIGSGRDKSHVLLGSAKLMFHLLPPENRFNIRLGLGPAIVSRGGSAYKTDSETKLQGLTDFGAVMSLCTRIPVADFFGIRLRAENYMYQAKIKMVDKIDPTNSITFDQRLQNDFMFSAGLQFTVNR